MKKLLLGTTLAAFACLSAVQAGENCCDKNKTACLGKDCSAKSAGCAQKTMAKKADLSVKGATLLVRR
jgi:hypothetical protein